MVAYQSPILTIIIPVYNAEKHIEKCLNSILNNECREFEVVIVDDGSEDNSIKKCREIAANDNRLRVYSQSNHGVSSARNKGLDLAKGKYIIFCDADDYYLDDGIVTLIHILKNTQYDMILLPFFQVTENGMRIKRCIHSFGQEMLLTNEFIKNEFWHIMNSGLFNSPWNKVYLRAHIEKMEIRFREDVSFSEDGIFNISYLNGGSDVLYVDAPIYNYIMHQGQATQKKVRAFYYMMCQAYDAIDSFISHERRNDIYWHEWLGVIKNISYHQNGEYSNGIDILQNERTDEMLRVYYPSGLFDKLILCHLRKHDFDGIKRLLSIRNFCANVKRSLNTLRKNQ